MSPLPLASRLAVRGLRATTHATAPATMALLTHGTTGVDEGNVPISGWVEVATEQWLYKALSAEEALGSEAMLADAEAWAPLASMVRNVDRVDLVALHGTYLPARVSFEVVGGPAPTDTTLHLYLKTIP